MLDKKHRLTARSLLEKTKKEGTIYQSESFGLVVNARKGTGSSRFAFVVSTKVAKSAVARNKIRRKLREIIRQEVKNTKDGYDVIFLVKKVALDGKTDSLKEEIKKVFKESGLIE